MKNKTKQIDTKPDERIRVAFFSLTCCEGCQLMFLSLEEELGALLKKIKLVNFREAIDAKSDDYDVAFVEGSVSRPSEREKLLAIRERATTLISFGACSTTGGLNSLRNRFPTEEVKRIVYGRDAKLPAFDTAEVTPIDEIVEVDYHLHGCPAPKVELREFLVSISLGIRPSLKTNPVCNECKIAGNTCVFEDGRSCMGPVTRGGCEAICVTYGAICWGCRGSFPDANITAHEATLAKLGLTTEEVTRNFDLYESNTVHKNKPQD